MLQQTQVPRVILYYASWLKKFPSWKRLAQASNTEVIHAWAGLGYNRRGLMLRDIAREVVERGVPQSEEEWRELKGIGPYTAAALAAFTLDQRTVPIDTNIRRVLGRLLLGIPYPQPEHDARMREAANDWLPKRRRYADIPQALFDLATSICTKAPSCAVCPLREDCLTAPKFLSGSVPIPKAMIKKAIEKRHRDKSYPDRIYRGRILKLVREANPRPVSISAIGSAIDPAFDPVLDKDWVKAMVGRLMKDGFLKEKADEINLA